RGTRAGGRLAGDDRCDPPRGLCRPEPYDRGGERAPRTSPRGPVAGFPVVARGGARGLAGAPLVLGDRPRRSRGRGRQRFRGAREAAPPRLREGRGPAEAARAVRAGARCRLGYGAGERLTVALAA